MASLGLLLVLALINFAGNGQDLFPSPIRLNSSVQNSVSDEDHGANSDITSPGSSLSNTLVPPSSPSPCGSGEATAGPRFNVIKGVDNGRCVAICDVSDDALNKGKMAIGTNPKTYKDYRQMLADSSVEAVLIATPVYLHYPMLEDSLKAGKHVFCEKSLVFTPEEIHKVKKMYPSQFPKQVLQVGLSNHLAHSAGHGADAQL